MTLEDLVSDWVEELEQIDIRLKPSPEKLRRRKRNIWRAVYAAVALPVAAFLINTGVNFSQDWMARKEKRDAIIEVYESGLENARKLVVGGDYESADVLIDSLKANADTLNFWRGKRMSSKLQDYDEEVIETEFEKRAEQRKLLSDYKAQFSDVKRAFKADNYERADELVDNLVNKLSKEEFSAARKLLEEVMAYDDNTVEKKLVTIKRQEELEQRKISSFKDRFAEIKQLVDPGFLRNPSYEDMQKADGMIELLESELRKEDFIGAKNLLSEIVSYDHEKVDSFLREKKEEHQEDKMADYQEQFEEIKKVTNLGVSFWDWFNPFISPSKLKDRNPHNVTKEELFRADKMLSDLESDLRKEDFADAKILLSEVLQYDISEIDSRLKDKPAYNYDNSQNTIDDGNKKDKEPEIRHIDDIENFEDLPTNTPFINKDGLKVYKAPNVSEDSETNISSKNKFSNQPIEKPYLRDYRSQFKVLKGEYPSQPRNLSYNYIDQLTNYNLKIESFKKKVLKDDRSSVPQFYSEVQEFDKELDQEIVDIFLANEEQKVSEGFGYLRPALDIKKDDGSLKKVGNIHTLTEWTTYTREVLNHYEYRLGRVRREIQLSDSILKAKIIDAYSERIDSLQQDLDSYTHYYSNLK
mgnify:CR=1 FL=1